MGESERLALGKRENVIGQNGTSKNSRFEAICKFNLILGLNVNL